MNGFLSDVSLNFVIDSNSKGASMTLISLPDPDQLAKARSAHQTQISLPDPDQLAKSRSDCKSIETGGLQPADSATAYKPP